MTILPTLQRRIRGDFFRLVFVFGMLGLLLVVAILLTGRIPTLMVRLNYDSIAWGRDMQTAMNGMRFGNQYPEYDAAGWKEHFEAALAKAKGNITEFEEPQAVAQIVLTWNRYKDALEIGRQDDVDEAYKALRQNLVNLIRLNEQAMFKRLEHDGLIRDVTVLCAAALFALGTLWAVLMADSVSGKVSHPLRRAAEVFKARPRLGTRLHLPPPQTLEVRILFDELERLWGRLSELDALNVGSLMAEKRKLEVILESADDAILVLDASGMVAHVSQRMLPLLGLELSQTLGMPWRDLSSVSSNYLSLRGVLDAGFHGKKDIVLQEADEDRIFSARRRDLVAPDGRIVGHVFLLGDVTEIRRREGLRSEMMDWVSHELKTPMQSLCLAADLLDRRKADFDMEAKLLVETVREDAARLRTLAQQFLEIARMTPAALRLSPERVNLSELLNRWLKPFVLLARETGALLSVDASSDVPLIQLDQDRFAWVVSNLVANALHASSRGDQVRLRLHANSTEMVLEVEDEGPGLPDSVHVRLFEPFSHGPAAGAREGLFGLGLAITRSIVDAHGGRIVYTKREPHGSCFTVSLPLKTEDVHAA